jgi:preprotein translocase subunit SecB
MLAPVNFDALYQQAMARAAQEGQGDGNAAPGGDGGSAATH